MTVRSSVLWKLLMYRISSYLFRGNYSFLDLEILRSQYINVRKLFKGRNYIRTYGRYFKNQTISVTKLFSQSIIFTTNIFNKILLIQHWKKTLETTILQSLVLLHDFGTRFDQKFTDEWKNYTLIWKLNLKFKLWTDSNGGILREKMCFQPA